MEKFAVCLSDEHFCLSNELVVFCLSGLFFQMNLLLYACIKCLSGRFKTFSDNSIVCIVD